MGIGWTITSSVVIMADKKKSLVKVPGSWSTLIVVLLIFAVKWYFGY